MSQTPESAAILEDMLVQMAAEGKIVLAGDVHMDFVADENVKEGKARITAEFISQQEGPTSVLIRDRAPATPLKSVDAFLIVGRRRHVALDRAVVSLGRSLKNDIVMEDPGVSRQHAQIRWRNGRFVIFDLGSRAGTMVNGQKVNEQELNSGDVIKLGGAAIIFGEEVSDREADERSHAASLDITQELSKGDPP